MIGTAHFWQPDTTHNSAIEPPRRERLRVVTLGCVDLTQVRQYTTLGVTIAYIGGVRLFWNSHYLPCFQ